MNHPHPTPSPVTTTASAEPARAYTLSDFDFELPPELIAQHPAPQRSASRLLDATCKPPADRVFRELPALLAPGDLLVFNDTQVIKARLFGRKATGGAVEVLVERILPGHEVLAHLRASKSPKAGAVLRLAEAFDAEVLGRGGPDDGLFRLRFPDDPLALLERHGHVPLPPYITHADSEDDARRYQTVFAAKPGAVAAPTAALHFDEGVLAALRERGIGTAQVTLHVGAGTFQPVRTENLAEHKMHSEWFEVSANTVAAIERTRAAGGRIVAVGTTTLRALESAAVSGQLVAGSRDTDLFITPGFTFRVVEVLITNFHLPKSTLMMLVSAFAGHGHIMALYRHAIEQRYRFFSYGDAMLLARTR
ncbi:tRNA preQ1(34) S-adenosylmethionine ribosyltransferase-isomerase QueA [Caldimonas aquatica]|uniref:S-adenosylmethionine:tRNA ribosyltransferase-isomerase n=1 Tax=Caldimonas aquatica TaxID=376175 RepID=A0ABY6MSB5_9BURK|nr:tRNA preQ1(34) S-adenosylmethionine ribosyltransferase-isomerase QueA [Schlegelella aquatica]UZD54904.1 tRNA preQ1(34) S-adenosylmethionine ribosyltransferase-isomerase QueA [Schlegelella aquatica]